MNSSRNKSPLTWILDVLRHLLILASTFTILFLIWRAYRYGWAIAVVAGIPLYIVMLNVIGFVTLPLYGLDAQATKALDGHVDRAKTQNSQSESPTNPRS